MKNKRQETKAYGMGLIWAIIIVAECILLAVLCCSIDRFEVGSDTPEIKHANSVSSVTIVETVQDNTSSTEEDPSWSVWDLTESTGK